MKITETDRQKLLEEFQNLLTDLPQQPDEFSTSELAENLKFPVHKAYNKLKRKQDEGKVTSRLVSLSGKVIRLWKFV